MAISGPQLLINIEPPVGDELLQIFRGPAKLAVNGHVLVFDARHINETVRPHDGTNALIEANHLKCEFSVENCITMAPRCLEISGLLPKTLP